MDRYFCIALIVIVGLGCTKDTLPKPKGYLRLSYPTKSYKKLQVDRPYLFDIATRTKVMDLPKKWIKVQYPELKASVDITYRPVHNNLRELLMDAEKLVFEHTIKAEQIASTNFENNEKKVYGILYDITGNSASQVQFHVTDSTKHFLKGSLFFHVKPNYDSILPAVDYIKKDMIRMMESLEWNNN